MEALNEYLTFLWSQFQYDWSVLSNPWMLYTVIPDLVYLLFFVVKWWVLLIPVTLPCTILSRYWKREEEEKNVKTELDQLLRG